MVWSSTCNYQPFFPNFTGIMLEDDSNGNIEISFMNALQEAKAILLFIFFIFYIPLHIK